MVKKIIISQIITVIFVALCRCTPETPTPVFHDSYTISVHPVKNPPFIGAPVALEYFDKMLYISDFHGDTLITVFDVENSQIISKGIIKGVGPGEYLPPLDFFLSGDTMFLINRRAFSLGYDILDRLDKHKRLSFNKLFSFSSAVSNLTGIDGKYLAFGYFDKRYAIFNSRGEKEMEFGDYPSFLFGEKDFPTSAKAMFHQAHFAANQNLRRVACVSTHVLDMVDFSSSPSVLKQIQLGFYDYKFTTGNAIYTEQTYDTSKGAIAVTSTDDYIYILFNPATPENPNLNTENEIWCFDWHGEPVKKFFVNQPIYQLSAVNDSIFYSLSYPEFELVKLSLEQNGNDY
jgi:hypothetical protein